MKRQSAFQEWSRRAAAMALLASMTSAMAAPPDAAPARAVPVLTFAAVGDYMAVREPLDASLPGQPEMLRILRSADVAFVNVEGTSIELRTFRGHPEAESGGGWLIIPPRVLTALRSMGFDLASRANNHATDWGLDGMRETNRRLDDAGLLHAGSGESLAAARAPRYLESPRGRVALVSFTTTFTAQSRAAGPYGETRSRPGVSVLRLSRAIDVDRGTLEALRRTAANVPPAAGISPAALGGPTESRTEVLLHGQRFREGMPGALDYDVNESDLAEITQAVREARLRADVVAVSVHSHEPGNWSETPANFMQSVARAMIDAGADLVVGHGPHQLRGIEIYRDRPIFYSLGNFYYQVDLQLPSAWAPMEQKGYDPQLMTPELARRLEADRWYEGVIAVSRFEGGRLAGVELHPLDLGASSPTTLKGVPRRASGPAAQSMLARLQRLSQPYGTVMDIERGTGYIRFPR